jgi:hypothetical protein
MQRLRDLEKGDGKDIPTGCNVLALDMLEVTIAY